MTAAAHHRVSRVCTLALSSLVAAGVVTALHVAPAMALSDHDTLIWGGPGTASGQFDDPRGVAAGPDGNLVYVADTGNNRIQIFTSEGIFVRTWGSYGSGNGQFNSPRAVATDTNGNVYVADNGNGRVQKFTSSGAFLTSWSVPAVIGVATDRANHVFSLSSFLNLVSVRTTAGADVTGWASFPFKESPSYGPERAYGVTAIATDPAGNVYVAANQSTFYLSCSPGSNETRENPVEQVPIERILNASGAVLAEGTVRPFPSDCYHGILERDGDGLAVDPFFHSSYVAQVLSDESRILDSALKPTGPGFRPEVLNRPRYPEFTSIPISSIDGLGFDCRGNLYATSRLSNRIIKYQEFGPLPFTPPCVTPPASHLASSAVSFGSILAVGKKKKDQKGPGPKKGKGSKAQMILGCSTDACRGRLEIAMLPAGCAVSHAEQCGSVIAKSRFKIAGGDAEKLTMPLSGTGRRALNRLRHLRVFAIAHLRHRHTAIESKPTVMRPPTTMQLQCPGSASFGGPIAVNGSVAPSAAGRRVEVAFGTPDAGSKLVAAKSDRRGRFRASIAAGVAGPWNAEASVASDAHSGPATAGPCTVDVPAPPPGPRDQSSITLGPCLPQIPFAPPTTFSGTISPVHAAFPVTLTYTRPDATTVVHTATTNDKGEYSDTLAPDVPGVWTAQASWPGDTGHLGAASPVCQFNAG